MRYYAVVGTKRADFEEWIVALVSSYALARVVGWNLLESRPDLLRCRVRWVNLSRRQVLQVVERWGREDALAGKPAHHSERLPARFREVYLRSYRATVEKGVPPPT
ncbi:MAG: hypothetical protein LC104_16730 [Bacteroidales bacterium]|nr:hypothetical protein [Bacteroidales bacterium]